MSMTIENATNVHPPPPPFHPHPAENELYRNITFEVSN